MIMKWTEQQFKNHFITTFLAKWYADKYAQAEMTNNPLMEDVLRLADEAYHAYK